MYLVVKADGTVASRAVVSHSETQWHVVGLGSVVLSKTISAALPPSAPVNPAVFLLHVPALHVLFVGRIDGDAISLKVVSSAITEVTAGQSGPAKDFLTIMKPVAQRRNDLPG